VGEGLLWEGTKSMKQRDCHTVQHTKAISLFLGSFALQILALRGVRLRPCLGLLGKMPYLSFSRISRAPRATWLSLLLAAFWRGLGGRPGTDCKPPDATACPPRKTSS
jgi:hypothetical protein